MSSSAPKNPSEDSPWTPDKGPKETDLSESKREITDGFQKIADGASEIVHGLLLLILIWAQLRDGSENKEEKTGTFDDGFGRWSEDEAETVRNKRQKAKEKRKQRMKSRRRDAE